MAPKRNPQLNEQMLKSILAPKSYMKGLIGGGEDKIEDIYSIPNGMSPNLCMIAVLGGILSKDNLQNMANGSSSLVSAQNDWKQVWFIRDFPGNDEWRGYNMMRAISSGRQKAIAAFKAYENGDPTALNELIATGCESIAKASRATFPGNSKLWPNTYAAIKLLDNAIKEERGAGINIPNPKTLLDLDLFNALDKLAGKKDELEDRLNSMPEEPSDERSELVLEISTYNKILHHVDSESQSEPNFVLQELEPAGMSNINGYENMMSTPEALMFNNKYSEEYRQTHFLKFADAVKDPEKLQKLFNDVKTQFEYSSEYQKETKNGLNLSAGNNFEKMEFHLPDTRSKEEIQENEKRWEKAKQEIAKGYQALAEHNTDKEVKFKNKLSEIAASFGLHNYQIFQGASKNTLDELLKRQLPFFIYDDALLSIVKIQSDNGVDFTATQVNSFGSTAYTSEYLMASVYANGLCSGLQGMQNDINSIRKKCSPESPAFEKMQQEEPAVFDISKDVVNLYDKTYALLNNFSKDKVEEIKNDLEALNKKIDYHKDHPEKTSRGIYTSHVTVVAKPFADFLSKTLLEAEKVYQENLADFDSHKSEPLEQRIEKTSAFAAKEEEILQKQVQLGKLLKQHPIGSRQTDVKLNLNQYLDFAKKEAMENPKLAEETSEYFDALSNLKNITDKLYSRDDDGRFKPMSDKDFVDLTLAYNQAFAKGEALTKKPGFNDSLILPIAYQNIKTLLQNDMAALMNINPKHMLSLPDAIEQGRQKRVDITGKELSFVGEISNKRYALSVEIGGKEVKGFFTKEKRFNNESLKLHVDKAFAAIRKKYPQLKPVVDHMESDCLHNKIFNYYDLITRSCDWIKDKEGINTEAISFALENVSFDDKELGTFLHQYHRNLGTDDNSSIPGRNVAMSKVANLFGMPEILAQSIPMEIENNGEITKVVFMENAKGKSLESLMPEDVERTAEDSNDNPSLINDIAKLQILDYICGNCDRHAKNAFYIFNEDKTKIIGLQGIDNDFSFGTKLRKSNERGDSPYEIILDNIKIIPKDLADRLMQLNDDALKASLMGTGITEKEMDAAVVRMNNIKNYINKEKIKVLSPEEMQKQSLKELAKEDSLFKGIYENTNDLKNTAQSNLEQKLNEEKQNPDKAPLKFENTEVLSGINKASLQKDAQLFSQIAAEITASQKDIFGKGSSQFRQLQTSINNYINMSNKLQADPTNRELIQLRAGLEAINESAESYLRLKRGVKNPGEKTKRRMDIASRINKYSKTRIEEFKNEAFRRDEINVEDMNAALKAQANKIMTKTAVDNIRELSRLTNDILKSQKCGKEVSKLLQNGLVASQMVEDVLLGKSGIETINSPDATYAETLIVYGSLLWGYKNQDKNIDTILNGIESQGADLLVKQLHDSEKMKNYKQTATLADLVQICAEDMDYLDIQPKEVKIKENKLEQKQPQAKNLI